MKQPFAWLANNCPNFYFMPSLRYDRIFISEEAANEARSWGCVVVPLFCCAEEFATHWIVNREYGVFDKESAESAIAIGKDVVPVTHNHHIPIQRDASHR